MTNRSDIVKALTDDGYRNPEPMLNRILNVIAASLAVGDAVSIRNFGKFEPRPRQPVVRKNPKTGVEVAVPAKTAVAFVAAPALKRRVNQLDPNRS